VPTVGSELCSGAVPVKGRRRRAGALAALRLVLLGQTVLCLCGARSRLAEYH
jgi:hypothetical protein